MDPEHQDAASNGLGARQGIRVAEGSGAGRPSAAFAQALDQVHAHTLENGLRLLIWRDRRIPNVALYNWVRVGSRNESTGSTGLAHFFEHMMFNGTSRHPQGDFDRLMEAHGASNNAYTSQDVTVYQAWFPRSALPLVLELESDRIAHLSFDPAVVENERQVVYSERRLRVDDSNVASLEEQVQAMAFLAHPYRNPVIGWPSDILSWTMADLQHFYRTYYAPNNCTLILAGDLDADETLALAQQSLGSVAPGSPAPAVVTREPTQQGERRLLLQRPGQSPLVHYAYHSISAADPLEPALNILHTILLGGDASRLNRALVEERKLAVWIGGGWPQGFDSNLFYIQATLPVGGSIEQFEAALDGELERLVADGVREQELRRAKNIVAADFWRGLSTIDGKARLLGDYAVMHADYRLLFAAPQVYEAVTCADVLAIARQVFDPQRRTIGVLLPAGSAEASAGRAKGNCAVAEGRGHVAADPVAARHEQASAE
jgi:zinc protease